MQSEKHVLVLGLLKKSRLDTENIGFVPNLGPAIPDWQRTFADMSSLNLMSVKKVPHEIHISRF